MGQCVIRDCGFELAPGIDEKTAKCLTEEVNMSFLGFLDLLNFFTTKRILNTSCL